MSLEVLTIVALVLAALPATLFVWNLVVLKSPPLEPSPEGPAASRSVSVLIPARNEVYRLGAALQSVIENRGVNFEVIVLDDHSTDGTPELVQRFMDRDSRIRLIRTPPLPAGWCGKQHACHVLSRNAHQDLLVFMDADVRLSPDALKRMVAFMERTGVALASGVPRQVTATFLERLLIPLVYFVLLGFLPIWRMRRCSKPAYAAGCGQLFIANAQAYHQVGGHSMIRSTLHDGIRLPRLFRQMGYRTDLFDATPLAECRMYEGAREVVAGLMKNAHEALAAPVLILPMTLVLLGGQVLPWVLLGFWSKLSTGAGVTVGIALLLTLLPRVLGAVRFQQPYWFALLQPVSIGVFVLLQWVAFFRHLGGKPAQWRGREYATVPGADTPSSHKPRVAHQGIS